ncbi:conserved hypothetical protein [Klebsiella pneumoniae]|nr:conserved hypothetical protein [Klebsiella pneumoniae]
MYNPAFCQVSCFDSFIDEAFAEASIGHDKLQINKAIGLHLMFHLPPLVTAKCLPRSSNSSWQSAQR